MSIGLIILILAAANSLSFFIARRIHGNGPDMRQAYRGADEDKALYFVAGMGNQPFPAFERLKHLYWQHAPWNETSHVHVKYSLWGYNPKRFAEAISKDIKGFRLTQVEFVSVGIGCQLLAFLRPRSNEDQLVPDGTKFYAELINPCFGRWYLQTKWRILAPILALIGAGLRFIIGWITLPPFLPGGYSISLYVDQLWHIAFASTTYTPYVPAAHVVLSRYDKFLDNDRIQRRLSTDKNYTFDERPIRADHGTTADPSDSHYYYNSIKTSHEARLKPKR